MNWKEVEGLGKVALNEFSPGELEVATGLSADMQRVWRRRGHLPARTGGRSTFDAREVAAIAVRHELARLGVPPSDTSEAGESAAPTVLYSALVSREGAADVRGSFQRLATVSAQFAEDDAIAARLSGSEGGRRYLWTNDPPEFHFEDDFAMLLAEERLSGIVLLDLTVVGLRLVENAPKPLFLIDVTDR